MLMEDINLDYLKISETKVDESFLDVQFNLSEFKIGAIDDWDKYG